MWPTSRTRCEQRPSRCSPRIFGTIICTSPHGSLERANPTRFSMNDVARLIDLTRYPLTEPDSPVLAARVAELRDALVRTGAAEAPQFLSTSGLARCIADAESLAPRHYKGVGAGTAYLEE